MEMIGAKTPEMVQKDIWVHMLAYNLLLTLMWQSAQHANGSPLQISLQGTRQQFNQFRPNEELNQLPKTVIASTLLCSTSLVTSSFPCVLIEQNPELRNADPRVFPGCSNLAQSSKLNWSLDTASVSAIHLCAAC